MTIKLELNTDLEWKLCACATILGKPANEVATSALLEYCEGVITQKIRSNGDPAVPRVEPTPQATPERKPELVEPEWMRVDHAAAMVGVTPEAIRQRAASGGIRKRQNAPRCRILVSRDDVLKLYQDRKPDGDYQPTSLTRNRPERNWTCPICGDQFTTAGSPLHIVSCAKKAGGTRDQSLRYAMEYTNRKEEFLRRMVEAVYSKDTTKLPRNFKPKGVESNA